LSSPRVLVLRTAGTNCDHETVHAVRLAGGEAERLHVRSLLDRRGRLADFGAMIVPGGFSYGDDLGAGTVLANQLSTQLAGELAEFVGRGRPVIGICNGFQVLVRLGILPGLPEGAKAASLVENESGKFEDRWVRLRVETGICPFLRKGTVLELPIAHKEGRFVARDGETLRDLEAKGQVAFRYVSPAVLSPLLPPDRPEQECSGRYPTVAIRQAERYPDNPNGSVAAIAGIVNPTGTVLGLMPHPERHIRGLHHPAWTRRAAERGLPADEERAGDGYPIFEDLVKTIRS
jgi:phosphoribosylformylglycinamidine (FGAM) synthase-like amidotransferase family enzyme